MREALVLVGFWVLLEVEEKRGKVLARDSTTSLDTKVGNVGLQVVLGRRRDFRAISKASDQGDAE